MKTFIIIFFMLLASTCFSQTKKPQDQPKDTLIVLMFKKQVYESFLFWLSKQHVDQVEANEVRKNFKIAEDNARNVMKADSTKKK